MTGAERLLAACRSEPVDATPVWFMRQSGGSLAHYRALRERHGVMAIARDPALAAEVAVEAQDAIGSDGAVLFADIMLPAQAMGMDLELTAGGPRIERPIRSAAEVAGLRTPDVAADLGFVPEAARRVRAGVGDRAAVIGIAGGPFTVAAYLVEGGPSRDLLTARRFALAEPAAWELLLERITELTCRYVTAQVEAGAQVVQLFDSWAGVLSPADHEAWAGPWARRVLRAIRAAGAPAIHFVAVGGVLLERLTVDADVVAVDTALPLAAARARLGDVAVQGNLDPARVGADWPTVVRAVDELIAANGGQMGHIANTGHAVPPDTATTRLADIVTAIHDRSAAGADRRPPIGVPA
ncbi:MAG: uroporphyrinogen decarboxylase [Candidatus Limnocylindria bacterium]